jgi:hypothetical protein
MLALLRMSRMSLGVRLPPLERRRNEPGLPLAKPTDYTLRALTSNLQPPTLNLYLLPTSEAIIIGAGICW